MDVLALVKSEITACRLLPEKTMEKSWDDVLEYYSNYSESELKTTVAKLAACVIRSHNSKVKVRIKTFIFRVDIVGNKNDWYSNNIGMRVDIYCRIFYDACMI